MSSACALRTGQDTCPRGQDERVETKSRVDYTYTLARAGQRIVG